MSVFHFFLLFLCLTAVFHSTPVFAQEKDETTTFSDIVSQESGDKTEDEKADTPSPLTADLKKARDILMHGAGDNSFARGFLVALLQPLFLAGMFSLGLMAGQMSERLKHIWVLPVMVYAATFIGAFITAYHSDWKPQFDGGNLGFLRPLQSTEMVLVVIGLMIGVAVGFAFTLPPYAAIAGAVIIGLILGFSQTADMGEHHNSLLPFWAGFGLTGLLLSIFGIGFETFFQSINLKTVTRLAGIATAAFALFIGAKFL